MKTTVISCLLLINCLIATAQDSVMYSRDFTFKEGIFLSFNDFKANNPVPKNRIVSKYDNTSFDFLKMEMQKNELIYLDNQNVQQTIKPGNVWGYCSGNSLFVRYGKDFNKVVVIGAICHFVAIIETYNRVYDPYYDYNYNARPNYEQRQIILDMKTGTYGDFNVENITLILKRDEKLYAEFNTLSKRKKRDGLFIYLKKYNDAHPLYFPGY